MSLVFVAVERCVFFSSSFLPISHSEFLKDNRNCDSFSHSENFYANRSGNMCKNAKSHQKKISLLYKLFYLRSGFSYQNYDEHICVHFFHCSVF